MRMTCILNRKSRYAWSDAKLKFLFCNDEPNRIKNWLQLSCPLLNDAKRCMVATPGVSESMRGNKLPKFAKRKNCGRRRKNCGAKNCRPTEASGHPVSCDLFPSYGATRLPKLEKIGFSSLCSVSLWPCSVTQWTTASPCATQVRYPVSLSRNLAHSSS